MKNTIRITTAKQLQEEYNNSGYIYIAQCNDFPGIYKVGWAAIVDKRMINLQKEYKTKGEFICLKHYKSKNSKNLERTIHKKLNEFLVDMKHTGHGGIAQEFFQCDLQYIHEIITKTIEEYNNHTKYIDNKCSQIWSQQCVA